MSVGSTTRWTPPSSEDDDGGGGWLPRPGDVIASRYRIERLLGGGGMGAVVAARQLPLDTPVAIKFLHPRLATDVANIERFVREAKAASRIRSEHVIRVLDFGTTDAGLPFIVMELLEGRDLGAVVATGGAPLTLAVDCVLQAADALAEAHAAGIVHRDVKPSNLWLAQRKDGSPFVKVLDFGISKLETIEGDSKLTDTRAVFGSPAYMSPEQIRSVKRVDHRTDVWALGVVLYELLAGRVPFEADNVAGLLAAITADPPARLSAVRPDVPPAIEQIILACLVKDPAQRASLGDLASALEPFASASGRISATRVAASVAPSALVALAPAHRSSEAIPTFAITDTQPDLTGVRRIRGGVLAAIGAATLVALGIGIAAMWSATRASPASSTGERASSASIAAAPPTVSIPATIASALPTTSTMPPAPSATPLASASTHRPVTAPAKKVAPRPTSTFSEDRK